MTPAVSIVVSTYNRADRLGLALESILAQGDDVPFELIVVDNNSTDGTRAVVEAIEGRDSRVRYAFEPRQGLSYGRNTGIELSAAPVIAFTDDDVRVAPQWVREIKHAFDTHPEVAFVGGRVLPNWLAPPPAWLTTAHWAPLALQDYGDTPVSTGRHYAICLVGANLAFRRSVFENIGLFAPALGRIKDGIGSTEDHDIQIRAWKAGLNGMYSPRPLVVADVTPDRLVRAYHRRWHRGHGRHSALMRLRELVPAEMGPMSEPANLVKLFGAPAFVYADIIRNVRHWVLATLRRQDPFFYSNQLRHVLSYLRTSYQIHSAGSDSGTMGELINFARQYLRKHTSRIPA